MFHSMVKGRSRLVARLMDSIRRGRQQDHGSTLDSREQIAEHHQDLDRQTQMVLTNRLISMESRIRTSSLSTTTFQLSDDSSSLFVLPLSTLPQPSSRNDPNSLLEELAQVLTFDSFTNCNNKVLRNGSSFTSPVSLTTKRSKKSSRMLSLRPDLLLFPKFLSFRNQQDLVASLQHFGQPSSVQRSTLSSLLSLLLPLLPVFSTGLLDYPQHSQRRTSSTLAVQRVQEASQEMRIVERLLENLELLLPISPPRAAVSLSPVISLLLLSVRTPSPKSRTSRASPRSSRRLLRVKEWSFNRLMDDPESSSNLRLDLHGRSSRRRRQQANRWNEIELPLMDFETKAPTNSLLIPHLLPLECQPLLLMRSVSVLRAQDASPATLRITTRIQTVP